MNWRIFILVLCVVVNSRGSSVVYHARTSSHGSHHGSHHSSSGISSSSGSSSSSVTHSYHTRTHDGGDSGSSSSSSGQSTITQPKFSRRKRRKYLTAASSKGLHDLFEELKNAIIEENHSEMNSQLKKVERLISLCEMNVEDLDVDPDSEEDDVADQLAAVLGISDLPAKDDDLILVDDSSKDTPNPKLSSGKRKYRRGSTINSDKQEIARLKKLVKKLKDHQATEVGKLVAVKKGVEDLVSSLSGTRKNLLDAKRESLDMEKELERIHKQAQAAADLEREISEIQEHAKINYETGQVELALDSGEMSHLSLDEVAAKMKGKHGHDSGLMRHDKADDILSNLADPAVLHADLRLLIDIVLLLGSATIGGMIAAVAYMPPIIGYIAGGVIVGPSGLDLVQTVVEVDTLAQFGSVFFLFAHGLEYSFSEQRQFQTVAVGGCVLSTAICAVCIQIYALASGIVQSPLEGALLGLSSSLSSLSLILDYLHEQNLLHTVHGKVMVGFLTFQGLMMGLLFSIPPAISGGVISVGGVGIALFRSMSGIAFVGAFAYVFARYAMPTLLEFLTNNRANYDELYLLGIVSLAMVMALLTEFLGLSLDLGAFFAGLMLAGSPYMKRTSAAIQPLASVFAAMLFASIGMIINPAFFWTNLGVISIVVIQIVVIKVIVVTTVVRLFSYSWKISIISGIGLAHVGEFSLLFSSKLQAHLLLSRRAYLIFLAATVTTMVLAPLVLRVMHFFIPRIMKLLNIPNIEFEDDYRALYMQHGRGNRGSMRSHQYQ